MAITEVLVLHKFELDLSNKSNHTDRRIYDFWAKLLNNAPEEIQIKLRRTPRIKLKQVLKLNKQEGYIFDLGKEFKEIEDYMYKFLIVQV